MGTKLAEPRYALKRVHAHSPIVIMATDRKDITAPRVQRRRMRQIHETEEGQNIK